MDEGAFYALKVRRNPNGGDDLRTMALIGAYPTFAVACDGAARACRAKRQDDDAREYRYLVRCRASVPDVVFARSAPRRRRWESALAAKRQSA